MGFVENIRVSQKCPKTGISAKQDLRRRADPRSSLHPHRRSWCTRPPNTRGWRCCRLAPRNRSRHAHRSSRTRCLARTQWWAPHTKVRRHSTPHRAHRTRRPRTRRHCTSPSMNRTRRHPRCTSRPRSKRRPYTTARCSTLAQHCRTSRKRRDDWRHPWTWTATRPCRLHRACRLRHPHPRRPRPRVPCSTRCRRNHCQPLPR